MEPSSTTGRDAQATLQVGIIGSGKAGARRINAVCGYPGATVAFVVDSDPQALGVFRSVLGNGTRFGDDAEVMLASGFVDVVIISTPPGLHEAHFNRACDAGVSNILVEKPLAVDSGAARRMVDRAVLQGVHLKVGSNLRQFSEVRALQQLAASGALGTIRQASFNIGHDGSPLADWASDPVLAGGGTLLDNGVHVVDLAFLLGALPAGYTVDASVDWGTRGIDREASWTLAGADTVCRFSASWSRTDGAYLDATLETDKGSARLVVGGPGNGLQVRLASGRLPEFPEVGNSWVVDTHHFLDHCLDGRSSHASGREGAAVLSVIDAVYRAAAQGSASD